MESEIEKRSLVDQLKYMEGYNKRLDSLRAEYNIFIQSFMPESLEFQINSDDINYIDVSEIQRNIIDHKLKKENDILKQAVQKRKSIEDELYELSRDNEGMLRFLPKYSDEEHNEKVDDLIELIGKGNKIECLYKKMIHNLFKPTIFPFILGSSTYFIGYLAFRLIGMPNRIVEEVSLSGGVLGFLEDIYHGIRFSPKNEDLPWKDAKYLDDKIKELF